MFDQLTSSLSGVLSGLKKHKTLTEEHVANALRQVRRSLLEADVSLDVVRHLTENIRDKAVGLNVIKGIDPAEQVVKIVHDEILALLSGGEDVEKDHLTFSNDLNIVLMVGLQGSGKTTSSGKLAKWLKEQEGKKVLLASLDNRRPAAQEQLAILGQQIDVDSLPIIADQLPLEIAKRALTFAKSESYDVVLLDSAGRMAIDDVLMAEIKEVKDYAQPHETLLVADSLTGQDAVDTAQNFHEAIGLTGIILTRIDGDGRGGAALSMRYITGQPIRFMGVGENVSAFEIFHPERIAGRILGMGDVVSLVEKAVANIDENEALSMVEKLKQGIFDYDDMMMQMRQMAKMGGMGGIANFIPGMQKIKEQIENANIDDNVLKKQEAIISSMTKKERKNPTLVNHSSRKKRIAKGAGVPVSEVNKLTQMHSKMAKMIGQFKGMDEGKNGGGFLSRMMKNMTGGGGDMLPDDMENPSAQDLKQMAKQMGMSGKMMRQMRQMRQSGQVNNIPGMDDLFGKKEKKKKKRIRLR